MHRIERKCNARFDNGTHTTKPFSPRSRRRSTTSAIAHSLARGERENAVFIRQIGRENAVLSLITESDKSGERK